MLDSDDCCLQRLQKVELPDLLHVVNRKVPLDHRAFVHLNKAVLQEVLVRVGRLDRFDKALDELEGFWRDAFPQRIREGHVATLGSLLEPPANAALPGAIASNQRVNQVTDASNIMHDWIDIQYWLEWRNQHLLFHLVESQWLLLLLLVDVLLKLVEEVGLETTDFNADLLLFVVVARHVDAALIERTVTNTKFGGMLKCLQDLLGYLSDELFGQVQFLAANKAEKTRSIKVVRDDSQRVPLVKYILHLHDVRMLHLSQI